MQRAALIAALDYPLQTPIHAEAAQIQRQSTAWAKDGQLLPTARDHMRCDGAQFGYLAARTAPFLSVDALDLLAAWCVFFFLHDDFADETPLGGSAAPLELWHDHMLAVVRGAPVHDTASPLVRAIATLRRRTQCYGDSPGHLRAWNQIAAYFRAGEWEAANRLRQQPPDIATYCAMRPLTGGLFAYLEIVCLLGQIDPTGAVRALEPTHMLTEMAIALVSLSNDVLSAEREADHGDCHNLVLLLEIHHTMSREAAARQTIRLHNTTMQDYLRASQDYLRRLAPQHRFHGQLYRTALDTMVRGSFDWTCATLRHIPADELLVRCVSAPLTW